MTKAHAVTKVPLPMLLLTALAPEILLRGSPDIEGSLFDREPRPGEKILTPQIIPGKRIRLYVSDADHAKTKRGKGWKAVVTDIDTGLLFAMHSAPCDIPTCHCAAKVVWVGEKL